MELIGTVVRLQVQRASLKVGQQPRRYYDPTPLCSVARLTLGEDGVVGWTEDGTRLDDVHSRAHPASKNVHGINGISIGFTAHYGRMRRRFPDLADGIAGENILVRTELSFDEAALARGLVLETTQGARTRLTRIVVAEPCVEFSRFAMRLPSDAPSDRSVAEALQFLGDGMRGFYASLEGPGDRVYLP